MTFGVLPSGFNTPKLADILEDVQSRNAEHFGVDFIQTDESPAGQLNALFARYGADVWAVLADIYSSLDPDLATGFRLDILGRLRFLERNGLTDAEFAKVITNVGKADVHLRPAVNAVRTVEGVTYARLFENSTHLQDPVTLIPPHSVCFVVVGGDDGLIAQEIFEHTVSGIGLYGNTARSVNDGELCRRLVFLRPTIVDPAIVVTVAGTGPNCEAPSASEVKSAIVETLHYTSSGGLENGQSITLEDISRSLSSIGYGRAVSLEVSYSSGDVSLGYQAPGKYVPMPFTHLVSVSSSLIEVRYG